MRHRPPPAQASKASNVFASIFLFLFSLPFAGMGTVAFCKGIQNLVQRKTVDGLGLSLVGFVFMIIGFGLMSAVIFGGKFQKKAAAIRAAHPDEPWLWRKEWADGRIASSGRDAVTSAWVIGGLWTITSGVFVAVAISKSYDHRIYFALLFPLVGLGLLVRAVRVTMEWKKFGQSWFKMLPFPGVVGGPVSGAIETSVKLKPEDGFHLKLRCVNLVRTGSGKDSSTSEFTLWEDERTLTKELLDDPRRSGIPVFFNIPGESRESDDTNPNNKITWRLEARAKVPGIDYFAQFEVPVFITDASASATPAIDPTAVYQAPAQAYQLPAHSRITLRQLGDGSTEFHFSAARNFGTVLSLTAFFLAWTAATIAIWWLHQSTFFSIVFGLVDAALALACFNLWFKSSRVLINPTGVTAVTRWLFFSRTRRFEADKVTGFTTMIGMTSGSQVYYNLKLIPVSGPDSFAAGKQRFQQTGVRPRLQFVAGTSDPVTLASGIPSKQEADWLIGEMTSALGRKREPQATAQT